MSHRSRAAKKDFIEFGSNLFADAANGTLVAGPRTFSPEDWPDTSEFTFGGILSVSDGSLTGQIYLYNLTDAETVAGTTLTTSSTVPIKIESAALTVGTSAGNLKTTEKIYEVRISVSGGSAENDITYLGSGFMAVD